MFAERVRDALPAAPAVADAMVASTLPTRIGLPASAVASAEEIASFTATVVVADEIAVLTESVAKPL